MAGYVVQKGDSWESIAGKVYNNQRMFARLAEANGWNGGKTLQPGDVISLPKGQANPYVSQTSMDRAANFNEGYKVPTVAPATPPVATPPAPTYQTPNIGQVAPGGGPVPTDNSVTLGVAGAGGLNQLPGSAAENPQPVKETPATTTPGAVSGAEPKAAKLYEPAPGSPSGTPIVDQARGQFNVPAKPTDPFTGKPAYALDKNGQPVWTQAPAPGSGTTASIWHDFVEWAKTMRYQETKPTPAAPTPLGWDKIKELAAGADPAVVAQRFATVWQQSSDPIADLRDGTLFQSYTKQFGSPLDSATAALQAPNRVAGVMAATNNRAVAGFGRGLQEMFIALTAPTMVEERLSGVLGPIAHDALHMDMGALRRDLSAKGIEENYAASRVAYSSVGNEAILHDYIKRYNSGADPTLLAAEMENPLKEGVFRAAFDPLNMMGGWSDELATATFKPGTFQTLEGFTWARDVVDGLNLIRKGEIDAGLTLANDAQLMRAARASDFIAHEGQGAVASQSKIAQIVEGLGLPISSSKQVAQDRMAENLIMRIWGDTGGGDETLQTLLDAATVWSRGASTIDRNAALIHLANSPAVNSIFSDVGAQVGVQLGDMLLDETGKIRTVQGAEGPLWIREAIDKAKGDPGTFLNEVGKRMDWSSEHMYPSVTDRLGDPKRGIKSYPEQIAELEREGKPVPMYLERYRNEVIPKYLADAAKANQWFRRNVSGPAQRWVNYVWLGWNPAFAGRNYLTDGVNLLIDEPSAAIPWRTAKVQREFLKDYFGYVPEWGRRGHGSPIGYLLEETGKEGFLDKSMVGQRLSNFTERQMAERIGGSLVHDTMLKGRDAMMKSLGPALQDAGYSEEQISRLGSLLAENNLNWDKTIASWTKQGAPVLPLSLNPQDYHVLRQFDGLYDDLRAGMADPANFDTYADGVLKKYGAYVDNEAAKPTVMSEHAPQGADLAPENIVKEIDNVAPADDFFTRKTNANSDTLSAYADAYNGLGRKVSATVAGNPELAAKAESEFQSIAQDMQSIRTDTLAQAKAARDQVRAADAASRAPGGGGKTVRNEIWPEYLNPGGTRDKIWTANRESQISVYEQHLENLRNLDPTIQQIVDNFSPLQKAKESLSKARAWDNIDVPTFIKSGMAFTPFPKSVMDAFSEAGIATGERWQASPNSDPIMRPYSDKGLAGMANSNLPEGATPFSVDEINAGITDPQRLLELRQSLQYRQIARAQSVPELADRLGAAGIPTRVASLPEGVSSPVVWHADMLTIDPRAASLPMDEVRGLVTKELVDGLSEEALAGTLTPELITHLDGVLTNLNPSGMVPEGLVHPVMSDAGVKPVAPTAPPVEEPIDLQRPLLAPDTFQGANLARGAAENEAGLRNFVDGLKARVKARWSAGEGTTLTPVPGEGISSQAKRMISDIKFKSNEIANAGRNRTIFDYETRYGWDSFIQNFVPFEFYNTRAIPRLARQIANNPGILVGYLQYRGALEKVNADMPDWWKYNMTTDMLGIHLAQPLYFNLESILNSTYRITSAMDGTAFSDANRRISWMGRFLDDLSRIGLGPALYLELGLAMYDYATNNQQEAQAYVNGRLIPVTATIKAISHAAGITAPTSNNRLIGPGGLELDPYVLLFNGGQGTLWENNRIGRTLGDMVQRGAITYEQSIDAAKAKAGPVWDAAISEAQGNRDASNILSGTGGIGFKGRTAEEAQIDQALSEEAQLFLQRPNMSPQAYSDKFKEIYAKYPWLAAIHLARKHDDSADESFVWEVYGRIPPGKTSDMAKAVGLDSNLMTKWFDTKGDLSKFTPAERSALMNGMVQLGTNLSEPPQATRQDWNNARARYKQLVPIPSEDLSNKWSAFDGLQASGDYSGARDFLAKNPDLADFLQKRESAVLNDPILYKYYGGISWLERYWKGVMYNDAAQRFGNDIFQTQADYYTLKDTGFDTTAYIADHPELYDYWDFLHAQQTIIQNKITDSAKWLPESPKVNLRPDAPADSVAAQAIMKGLTETTPKTDAASNVRLSKYMVLQDSSGFGKTDAQALNIEAEKTWPGVVLKEQKWTELTQLNDKGAQAKAYLAANPDLAQEIIWRKARQKEMTAARKVTGVAVPTTQSWQAWTATLDPAGDAIVTPLLIDYFRGGTMSADLQSRLKSLWASSGQPGTSFNGWIETMKTAWKAAGGGY